MNYTDFSIKLLIWYNIYKRELPWRENFNPYFIWVSEIIMQQTKVSQGLSYYFHFIDQFPTLKSLADATEDDVLKTWQGLGYYSRARNMHSAAKVILNDLNEVFPSTYTELLKLKGVGQYTAAAIASIAFNEKVPAIDGNVMRVIARIFGVEVPVDTKQGKAKIEEISSYLIPNNQPGDYNQAMMEFGALQCTPKKPACLSCIFQYSCVAFQQQKIELIPAKLKKVKQRIRYFNYFYIENNDCTFVHQRRGKDIWKNLYELPLIELQHDATINELAITNEFHALFGNSSMKIVNYSSIIKHQLSHQLISTRFIHVLIENENFFLKGFEKIAKNNIFELAVSRLIENFLNELKE